MYGFQCFISECSRVKQDDQNRRQIFRWLHQQKPDVVFLQETYSSAQNLKTWEAEWGGKMIGSHGTNHSRGVMILFMSKLDVNIEQIICDKNGRYILAEALIEGEKFVFLNIYAPNDQTQQVQFLRGLSNSVLNKHAGERIVLGGDLNCVMNEIDKRGALFRTKEDSYSRNENSYENSQSS